MGACQGSSKGKDKNIKDERVRTEPDQGRESDAFTGGFNIPSVSRKSAEAKVIDQNLSKKYSMKKQESLKVTLSLTQGPMSKYYTKKNLRYLEGVNFRDNMCVVQHKVTGKIRIAETYEKNPKYVGFVNKIIYLQLDHPNLLEIYAIFEEENQYILVMDYCNGGSLLNFVQQKQNKLGEEQVTEVCRQIYDLMSYLHKYGLVHGSLNLKSFEKWNQGKSFKIKLTDFSCFFNRPEINIGNAQFLSPECCSDKQNYSLQRDYWAIGIITMILHFKKFPFDGISVQEILDQIQQSCKKDNFITKELEKLIGNQEIKELIIQFLQITPSKRVDFQQALESKWMKNYDLVSKTLVKQYLGELSKKKETNFLQSCFLLMLIKQFDEKLTQVQEIFNGLDTDKNGRLTKPELIQSYQKYFNAQYNQKEIVDFVNEIFDASDLNHSGDIEFSEFVIAMSNKKSLITQENMQMIFNQINNGSPIELNSLLPFFKTKEFDLQASLKDFPNQEINFDEFQKMMYELIDEK